MPCEFDAELKRLEGKMVWPVLYAPAEWVQGQGISGRRNVRAVVDGREFLGTLLPSRNGHYLVYNREMKEHCQKELGETLHVIMETDDRPRTVELPEEVRIALECNQELLSKYQALPYYIQREEINKITSAKTVATRERRISELIQKLKK